MKNTLDICNSHWKVGHELAQHNILHMWDTFHPEDLRKPQTLSCLFVFAKLSLKWFIFVHAHEYFKERVHTREPSHPAVCGNNAGSLMVPSLRAGTRTQHSAEEKSDGSQSWLLAGSLGQDAKSSNSEIARKCVGLEHSVSKESIACFNSTYMETSKRFWTSAWHFCLSFSSVLTAFWVPIEWPTISMHASLRCQEPTFIGCWWAAPTILKYQCLRGICAGLPLGGECLPYALGQLCKERCRGVISTHETGFPHHIGDTEHWSCTELHSVRPETVLNCTVSCSCC